MNTSPATSGSSGMTTTGAVGPDHPPGFVAAAKAHPESPAQWVGALIRYVLSAALARTADAGAAVGLVFLAISAGRAPVTGGILAACLTAPHLLGPLVARRLDRAADGRKAIALACIVYAMAIAAASALFPVAPLVVIAALAAIAGACGPLLTGGISSRLVDLMPPGEGPQRRALGFDALTYGVAGTVGPALVTALVAAASPDIALYAVAAAAAAAAGVLLTLPRSAKADGNGQHETLSVQQALRLIAVHGPLRRVSYVTTVIAAPNAASALFAVALIRDFHVTAARAGVLIALEGVGALIATAVVVIRPLRGNADRLVLALGAAIAASFGLRAIAPSFGFAAAAFIFAGAIDGVFFTATLAARAAYAPVNARAQIFVTLAGLKVAAAAAGTAIAGVLLHYGGRPKLFGAAVLCAVAITAGVVDLRLTRK